MTTIPDLLKLLFATFPPPSHDDAPAQLAAYAMSLEGHDIRDIEAGVRKLIRGTVPEHNPSFAPSASLLGKVVGQCAGDRRRLEELSKPYLPPPEIPEPSPEAKARVRALVNRAVNGLAGKQDYEVGDPDGDRDVA